jgi:hypothetical protein
MNYEFLIINICILLIWFYFGLLMKLMDKLFFFFDLIPFVGALKRLWMKTEWSVAATAWSAASTALASAASACASSALAATRAKCPRAKPRVRA